MLYIKKSVKNWIVASLLLMALPSFAYAVENCRDVYQLAMETLQKTEAELLKIKTKSIYQQSVNLRYNGMEELLGRAIACEVTDNDVESLRNIHKVRMALSSLQASAQASAFTKFADWTSALELDLNISRKVTEKVEK